MNYKLYDNGQIMKIIAKGHEVAHTMNNIIELSNATANVSVPFEIPVIYKIFDLDAGEHIVDTSINKTVDVYVNGEIAGTDEIVNGEGLIEFESEEAGTFVIKVENTTCEVIVHEN